MGILNHAQKVYGSPSATRVLPKYNFAYTVEFLLNPQLVDQSMNGRVFEVATTSLPGVNYATQVNNSYNTKVVTVVNRAYTPVTMTIRDASDGRLNSFLNAYDSNQFNSTQFDRQTDRQSFQFQEGLHEGIRPSNFRDPISKINIRHYHNQGTDFADTYTLFRPVISTIERTTLSYAESTISQFNITFEYETYKVDPAVSDPLTGNTDFIDMRENVAVRSNTLGADTGRSALGSQHMYSAGPIGPSTSTVNSGESDNNEIQEQSELKKLIEANRVQGVAT